MAINNQKKEEIKNIVKESIRNKFRHYKPETISMPFHYRLLGKDRMALYSFIQSLNTTFGTSIFEPVAVALARDRFTKVCAQYSVGNTISQGCQQAIQTIMNNLSMGKAPCKPEELEAIRNASLDEEHRKIKTVKVDLFLEDRNGEQYLFDLKTAKPNISNFKDFKRTLLEWAGIIYTTNSNASVNTLIAIPYNPYEPQPYERWTIKGMLDDNYELMVGEEFWNFLGGVGVYDDLLDCFEIAGIELRPEIDGYFANFTRQ